MEYKTDKRTKNLTLRDIHVGDWVQVWSEQTERYSPPLKITQICDDGTIYLVTSDEERCTPWQEDIKNVDALPITEDVLLGFGFIEDKDVTNTYKLLLEERKGSYPDNYLYAEKCGIGFKFYFKVYNYTGNGFEYAIENEPLPMYENYIHELQQMMYYFFKVHKLEWKGIKK